VSDDPIQIVDASFVAGAGPSARLPPPAMAEIAFAGRSNVGKSSLINTLIERKRLVRTSATPGSTRQINLFEARARDGAVFHMVDLPGYGFTSGTSKTEKAAWGELIEGYLRERVTLAAVVLIVDVRRGPEEDDLDLIRFVESTAAQGGASRRKPVEVILVATKLDKVPSSSRKSALEKVARLASTRRVIGFSSVTGEGRRALWVALRRAVGLLENPAGGHPGHPAQDD
jgi:GTP-binding protein